MPAWPLSSAGTMQELKEELENLGLPTDGKKADLVERLYASETEESAAPGKPAAGPTDAADAAAEEAAAEAPAHSGPALPKVGQGLPELGWCHDPNV